MKIRQHKSQGRLCGDDRAIAVGAILSRSPLETHTAVAQELGLSRETVRKVRYGEQWAEILPELPRLDPAAQGATCWQCTHWKPRVVDDRGACTLGIPEAMSEGQLYARACGAFSRAS